MTIKECIDIVDNIKPNQYTIKDKVMWLSFLDEIIINEVLKTHEGYDGRYDAFTGYSEDKLSVALIVPSPYDRLYTAYLKMKIDGENGETARYNNSAVTYNTYMMEYRKYYNKTHMPLNTAEKCTKLEFTKKYTVGLTDAEFESLKRDLEYILKEYFSDSVSPDKLYAAVNDYAQTNLEMLKGKDGYTPVKGTDYFTEDEIAKIKVEAKGDDGYSPTIKVTKIENGYNLYITDKNQTYSVNLMNGWSHDGVLPIDKGEGDTSLVMGDIGNNKALSENSIATGLGNVAGRKAYYIKSIDSTGGKIYLSKTQVKPVFSTADNTSFSFATPKYDVGDEFSIIVGGSHYILCGTIQSIKNNVISYNPVITFDGNETITQYSYDGAAVYRYKVEKPGITSEFKLNTMLLDYMNIPGYFQVTEIGDGYIIVNGIDSHWYGIQEAMVKNKLQATGTATLPFTEFQTITSLAPDDYTLCVPTKPNEGVVTLGDHAFVAGVENVAAGYASVASGYDNVAAGNFSAVFGRHNKVGYAGLVSGFNNTAIGNGSAAFGYHNKVDGNQCYAMGNTNITSGDNNHLKGNSNTVSGSHNHVDGRSNTVSGSHNKVSGDANTVDDGSLNDVSGRLHEVTGSLNVVRGNNNIASGNQVVLGRYNKPESDKILIIGNGTSDNNRSNILTVDASGRIISNYLDLLTDDYYYTFDNYRKIERFVTRSANVKISCYDRAMRAESTSADPQIYHDFLIPMDGSKYPYLNIRYRADSALTDTTGKIYFTTTDEPTISEDKRLTFTINTGSGWQGQTIMMFTNEKWKSQITSLRFDIPNQSQSGVVMMLKAFIFQHDAQEVSSFTF